ncbi:hypothetical protein MNBD_CHLOROFLEXI01-134 [hydrothermal vent metagenome]|uniref:Uncharacterized protein n=1 Tax=hydrothermal vent metagenome TaxID=652676 RepID=A0A3B0VAJ5_9ZZZZ
MSEKRNLLNVLSSETQFVSAGTLPIPGLAGRFVRILFGLGILYWLIPGFIQSIPALPTAADVPTNPLFWIIVVITFVNTSYVINLGLGKSWGRRPQIVFLLLAGVALLADVLVYGRFWAAPLATIIVFWLILINLPLGVAFILATILGTPGCEMRSYNHLVSKLQGSDPREYFCPSGIDFADAWGAKQQVNQNKPPSKH